MNERIQELMEQASSNACYDEPGQFHLMNLEIERFVELIVQECINVLHDNELWNRHISHALKAHFGVSHD